MCPTSHPAIGTTSACAENTCMRLSAKLPLWNYLRVRGEYTATRVYFSGPLELPPRARRILQRESKGIDVNGTTSACAENTGNHAP